MSTCRFGAHTHPVEQSTEDWHAVSHTRLAGKNSFQAVISPGTFIAVADAKTTQTTVKRADLRSCMVARGWDVMPQCDL